MSLNLSTLLGGTRAFGRGYIDGLILSNNVSDANNDIDIAIGQCRDSTNEDAWGAAISATASLTTLSVPLGICVNPLLGATVIGGTAAMLLSSPDVNDVLPDRINWSHGVIVNGTSGPTILVGNQLRTNTSSQVRVRANAVAGLYLQTHGWIDPRGKDAA